MRAIGLPELAAPERLLLEVGFGLLFNANRLVKAWDVHSRKA